MWPWEHLAVGYLVYSVSTRIRSVDRPDTVTALAVVLGTQLPDLVDKPMAWALGVFPSGTSVAHSVFVAVPLSIVVIGIAANRGRREAGIGFAVGYLLHLPGDLMNFVIAGEPIPIGVLLWPLVVIESKSPEGILVQSNDFFVAFLDILRSPLGLTYLVAEATLILLTMWVWTRDGMPGLGRNRETHGVDSPR